MNNIDSLYFDYQATTPVADEVYLKMQPYFRESFANPHSTNHILGWNSAAAIEGASQQIASLIGADSDEIIYTSGATESNNLALLGLARHASLSGSPRKRILVSAIEHKCILSIGRILEEQYGFAVDIIPTNQNGHINYSELERLLADDVLAVSIMAVNNEIGTIQDISRLSGTIRATGAVFHCDAAQAPIAIPMGNFAADVDMLSLSGHKMYAPKGIGALYVCRNLQDQIEPLIYGGDQQRGLRSGTLPTPLCVGMGAAAEYMSSLEIIQKRNALRTQRDRFFKLLTSLPWQTKLIGPDLDQRHPGNLSIAFLGFDARDILDVSQPHLAASTGSACTSGIPEPSHVLSAIGLATNEAESVIRFSLGFETTDLMIEDALIVIDQSLNKLSGASTAQSA